MKSFYTDKEIDKASEIVAKSWIDKQVSYEKIPHNEFECDCCGTILTKEQMKIEKKLNTEFSACYCDEIILIDKKNKQIKKLKKLNSEYFSFLMEHNDMLGAFEEWSSSHHRSKEQ